MQNIQKKYDFYIENLYGDWGAPSSIVLLESQISKILDELFKIRKISEEFTYEFETLSFDIVFCNDEKIREINHEYRNKDRATDVITFSLFADDENKFIHNGVINLGEVIISVDTLKRQAEEGEHSLQEETLTLLTHGILHLLGFDHQSDMDYNFIVETQNSIVKGIIES